MEKQESTNRFPTFPQPRRLRSTFSYGIRVLGARPIEGFYQDVRITWHDDPVRNADGIYLKMLNGRLEGRFVTSNFLYSTHGNETTYTITCELISNNKMRYSVWSAIRGGKAEKFVATKIGN